MQKTMLFTFKLAAVASVSVLLLSACVPLVPLPPPVLLPPPRLAALPPMSASPALASYYSEDVLIADAAPLAAGA